MIAVRQGDSPSFLQKLLDVLMGGEICGQVADSIAQPGKSGQRQTSRFLCSPYPCLPHRLCTPTLKSLPTNGNVPHAACTYFSGVIHVLCMVTWNPVKCRAVQAHAHTLAVTGEQRWED